MPYTVATLAKMSGVSVRTLHFYDEIGLLKPAYTMENGYRYYEEKELLRLQQILFYRELGIELKKIQKILSKSDFDKIAALQTHRKSLQNNIERSNDLIKTIDKTINHLSGGKKMKDQEMYYGFISKEQQAEYEEYLKNRLNADDSLFVESRRNIKNWTKKDWDDFAALWAGICKELAAFMESGVAPDAPAVQKVIARHNQLLKKFGTYNKEAYIGVGKGYTELAWKKTFAPYDTKHPRLALYMAQAMEIFAHRNL